MALAMRTLLFFSFMLIVSGCVQKTPEPSTTNCLPSNTVTVHYYHSTKPNMSQSEYIGQIKNIISSKMYGVSAYKGQRCRLRLNARNKIATVERGDLTLCMALLYTISSAAFPTVPDGIQGKDSNELKNIPIDVNL